MKTWKIVYPDGSNEVVTGNLLTIYNGILTLEMGNVHMSRTRKWPLTALRSWEEV